MMNKPISNKDMINKSLQMLLRPESDTISLQTLQEKTNEVRKLKNNLHSIANSYCEEYTAEIAEGTKNKQLLIENGKQNGISGDDAMSQNGKYIPTTHTPILNFLYFMLRDESRADWESINDELYDHYGFMKPAATKDELEHRFGQAIHSEKMYNNVNEPNNFDTFIYKECNNDIFQKIKKLKAMSKSSNENEAKIAHKTAIKLCDYYNLEFDKIPCNIDKE